MVITYSNATIIQADCLTSAKGRAYGKLRFISSEMDVFELFVREPEFPILAELSPKDVCDLSFSVEPAYRGGVDFRLVSAE